MNRAAASCLLLALLVCTSARAATFVEGRAVRLDSGAPVYTEVHRFSGSRQQVDYRDPQGEPIARLELDYACDAHAPAFEQVDQRAGSTLAGQWRAGRYVLTRAGDGAGSRGRSAALALDRDPLVASSGFDRYLRDHWEQLLAGNVLHLRFAMPERLSTIRLRARHDSHGTDPALTWFLIEPDSALLRVLASPIRVAYDAERRLRVYEGHSNLTDADGRALTVRISYHHGPGEPQILTTSEPGGRPGRIRLQSECPSVPT